MNENINPEAENVDPNVEEQQKDNQTDGGFPSEIIEPIADISLNATINQHLLDAAGVESNPLLDVVEGAGKFFTEAGENIGNVLEATGEVIGGIFEGLS